MLRLRTGRGGMSTARLEPRELICMRCVMAILPELNKIILIHRHNRDIPPLFSPAFDFPLIFYSIPLLRSIQTFGNLLNKHPQSIPRPPILIQPFFQIALRLRIIKPSHKHFNNASLPFPRRELAPRNLRVVEILEQTPSVLSDILIPILLCVGNTLFPVLGFVVFTGDIGLLFVL